MDNEVVLFAADNIQLVCPTETRSLKHTVPHFIAISLCRYMQSQNDTGDRIFESLVNSNSIYICGSTEFHTNPNGSPEPVSGVGRRSR